MALNASTGTLTPVAGSPSDRVIRQAVEEQADRTLMSRAVGIFHLGFSELGMRTHALSSGAGTPPQQNRYSWFRVVRQGRPVRHRHRQVAFGPDFDIDGQGFYEEDVVLITAHGYQLIYPPFPYSAADIERTMARVKRPERK